MINSIHARILAGLIIITFLIPVLASADGDEFRYAKLKTRLFQCEKQLSELSQKSNLDSATRLEKVEKLQSEIAKIKVELQGKFEPADIGMGGAIEAIQKYGRAWALNILTHGRFTGRKKEHHKPLEALDIPSKNPEFAGRAALPFQGYALMVILSYDPVCREAYSRFIPKMEEIVRKMEAKSGKPCEFFKPIITPNDVGFDVDAFWATTQGIAGDVVRKYFWNYGEDEIRDATNFVSLVMAAALFSNVTIDLTGDPKEQSRIAFWRANAGPWFVPDVSLPFHKFDICHFFTHAWLVYLKMMNDTNYGDGKILRPGERRIPGKGTLYNAFVFSNITGFGYECISSVAGTKHGLLETTETRFLPKGLKKVAQALGLKNVIGFESFRDLKGNLEGAYYGAVLFLTKNPPKLSERELNKKVVQDWLASLKDPGTTDELDKLAAPENTMPGSDDRGLISGYDLNAPEGKKRIDEGFFSEVYRGLGGFTPSEQAAGEIEGFGYLLGKDSLSYNLIMLYKSFLDNGLQAKEAWKRALAKHKAIILEHFSESGKRPEIWRDLFSNNAKAPDEDAYNHEADYIYATRKADIAGCYGSTVLVIHEKQPRGIDLNQIADGYKYYGFKKFMKKAITWKWKTLLGDYILDVDEYVIPSYLPATDVVGMQARAPTNKVTRTHVEAADKDFAIAWKAPPLLRRYEKQFIGGYLVIDVFDSKGKLIKRLSENPDRTPFEGKIENSAEKLPQAIQAAWETYLAKLKKN